MSEPNNMLHPTTFPPLLHQPLRTELLLHFLNDFGELGGRDADIVLVRFSLFARGFGDQLAETPQGEELRGGLGEGAGCDEGVGRFGVEEFEEVLNFLWEVEVRVKYA